MYKVIMLVLLVVACLLGLFCYRKQVKAKVPVVYVNAKDGASMVLIPAGEFLMGRSDAEISWLKAHPDDSPYWEGPAPQHKVYLDAYYMYQTEVTVAQYRKFCKATKREMPWLPDWNRQDTHPILVDWNDAKAYADWAGAVLPSEAQWEKAARGGDGRLFPWGNDWPPPAKSGNFNDKTALATIIESGETSERDLECIKGYDDGFAYTSPVGSFTANPYGVYDLAGNAWEWCADWYDLEYYNNSPAKNPAGPAKGEERVLRGGSWVHDGAFRSSFRAHRYSTYKSEYAGFRCVVRLPRFTGTGYVFKI